MRKALPLIALSILLTCPSVLGHPSCFEIFLAPNGHAVQPRVFSQIEQLLKLLESNRVLRSGAFEGHELAQLRENLAARKSTFSKSVSSAYRREILGKWEAFNEYWLAKVAEYNSLPVGQQALLREAMQSVLALSTRHFAAFLKENHHLDWKLARLIYLLEVHKEYDQLSVYAALMVFYRQVTRHNSIFEFLWCRV